MLTRKSCCAFQPIKCQRAARPAVVLAHASKGTSSIVSSEVPVISKRQLMQATLMLVTPWTWAPGGAMAGENASYGTFRALLRPDDITPEQAVVVMMDARSVLRDIAALAATPFDSQERFQARKLWPGFAKRLRDVGPAAPVVASLVLGASDKEETLSELYGGKSSQPGLTDDIYKAMGLVLTISGRTIRPEAQASPEAAQAAQAAIDEFLAKVPKDIVAQAQDFRVQRAAAAAKS